MSDRRSLARYRVYTPLYVLVSVIVIIGHASGWLFA